MSAERPRDVDSANPVVAQASSCLRGCGADIVGRVLFLLVAGAMQAGMGLLIGRLGVPLALGSLFVLGVVLLEFWPREPYPPRSRWRWLYYGPIAGLVVSVSYAIYLGAQDSEDLGWWALVAGVMLALLLLAAKVDRWLRGE